MSNDKKWRVYIVQCKDGTLYTGITNDIAKRVRQHNNGKEGAKYTNPRRPVVLVYVEETASRSEALKKEYQIRKLSLSAKHTLIVNGYDQCGETYAVSGISKRTINRFRTN